MALHRFLPAAALICLNVAAAAFAFEAYDSLEGAFQAPDSALPAVRAITHGPEYHWFGYYDVQQVDESGRYALGMAADFENRTPEPDDAIETGMIDLENDNEWIRLGSSRAWCWQQGCRLQWRPGRNNEVVWNDRRGDRFVCHILNIESGEKRTLPYPVYHIAPDGKWALGLDFARVHDMRAGYGYAGVPDRYADVNAPEDSGVYRLDLDTGRKEPVLSLADIARIRFGKLPAPNKIYFNHIMWNTAGSRFFVYSRGDGVRTHVYTAGPDGRDVRLLAKDASHYDWRDTRHVMIWGRGAYRLYEDDGSCESRVVWEAPNGHNSYLPGDAWVLTDTYPMGEARLQHLYLRHLPSGKFVPLGHFPSPPEYAGEWRCDLHPRQSPDGTKVIIDSAHGGNGRQMYMIDISQILAAAEDWEAKSADADSGARSAPHGVAEMQKRAAVWIEAESAAPAPGIDADGRKPDTTSAGECLGVHCDEAPNLTCSRRFEVRAGLAPARLALRYASETDSAFYVELDGNLVGELALPQTGGWGYNAGDWQWGMVTLVKQLDAGEHTLLLRASESGPVNIDCVAIVAGEDAGPVQLHLRRGKAPAVAKEMKLGEWERPENRHEEQLELPGRQGNRAYFDEFLPAVFERTIAVDEITEGASLNWVFTGSRGGITVTVGGGEVEVIRRFYDSSGYRHLPNPPRKHHPEWQQTVARVRYESQLRAITVGMNHRLGLEVALNEEIAFSGECLLDVTRHQLVLGGKDSSLRGSLLSPESQSVVVRVEPEERHQRMMGFGGIASPAAYAQLSREGRRRWWRLLCEYNLLIQREYPIGWRLNEEMNNWDELDDARPHYYGDNFPNGEISNFAYIRRLRELGGKVWFEFWALPPWVDGDAAEYAEAMVGYCRASQEAAGGPPDIVGIQNESRQSEDMYHRMAAALRAGLDRAGFESVRIHMSDAGTLAGGIKRAGKFRASDAAWAQIDYAASHMYDFQGFFTDPDGYDARLRKWREVTADKPFLSTELCINSTRYQHPSYRLALLMGQLYHKNLTIADASAICYCWTLLNVVQPSYGWTRTLFVPDRSRGFMPVASSHQLRVFGAYSRRVVEGMTRVSARTEAADLLVTAFSDGASRRTVVMLNRGVRPVDVRILWPGATFSELETADPYHENAIASGPLPRGGSVHVDPGAVVTLTNVPLQRLPERFAEAVP